MCRPLPQCGLRLLLYARRVLNESTTILSAVTRAGMANAVQAACEAIRSGEPVALPTETVYGLAADALNATAVARIFEAKERPFFDPLICHVPSADWIEK